MTNSSGTHHKYKGKKNINKMSKKEKKKFFMRQSKKETQSNCENMENKVDKYFMLMVSVLFIIMILDLAVTSYSLSLGFTEGNPLVRYFFEKIGVKTTVISLFFITGFFLFGLIYVREKIFNNEKRIRFLYALVGILMSYRAFVVGTWFGLLAYKMEGII